jgi:hypothetical protein
MHQNVGTSDFIKQTLPDIPAQTDPSTMIVGDFILHSNQYIGNLDKKIKKEPSELNDTIDQIDLTDICRIFYPSDAGHSSQQPMKLFPK